MASSSHDEDFTKVICTAAFSGDKSNSELSLAVGDLLVVTHKGDNGWWVGQNIESEEEGVFPGSYVDEDVAHLSSDALGPSIAALEELGAELDAKVAEAGKLSLDMMYDSIVSEIAGAAAEALQAGFLTKGNMQKPETVSYLTSQVVSIMLIRSLGAKDAITLENGLDVVEGMFPAEFSAIFAKMLATKQVIADSGIAGNADTGAAADVSMLALLHQSFLEPASGAEPASAGGKKIKGIHDKIDGITRALNQHALFDSRYQQLCDAVANAAPTKEKSKLQRAGSEVSRLFGKFKIGVKSAIEKAQKHLSPLAKKAAEKGSHYSNVVRDAMKKKMLRPPAKKNEMLINTIEAKPEPPARPPTPA